MIPIPEKWLLLDISNILYRTFYAQHKEDADTIAGLAAHSAFVTLNKYYKMHNPTKIIMAFDRTSWRKAYTNSSLCVSGKPYKGNRRQSMTPQQQAKYAKFIDHLNQLEQLIIQHTTVVTMYADQLEADDLIAGVCQHASTLDNVTVVVVSTDSDLHQLLKYPNVTITSPATSGDVHLSDPEYYVFLKCIRGDPTDNVLSAYPKVRESKILAAYNNPIDRVNLMNTTWDGLRQSEPTKFKVGDLFEENQMLIDLSCQPDSIKQLIQTTVLNSLSTKKYFSMFHFLKFVGQFKLDKLRETIDTYIPLLSR